ncbi:LysM peptidoglycan-binding domain-containing protein [Thalassobacillus sp. B23F22_16]|uniref:LysM peptidoglycan-binding domain-containing protein n=1 Tax=Thalassobacillus sp. B23F22_16 TaxID=3459513 RepID=UPI00373E64AF
MNHYYYPAFPPHPVPCHMNQHELPSALCSSPRKKNFYIIQPGDSIYNLAHFFNVSIEKLITNNPGIHPFFLMPGQVISIPLESPTEDCPQIYTIKPGDTFYNIAMDNNLSVKDLMTANPDINPNALLIGQEICLPLSESRFIRLWRLMTGIGN